MKENNKLHFNQNQFNTWNRFIESKKNSKPKKKNPIVAYGGTTGSYSEDATINFFGQDVLRVPCRNFEDIFKSITGGQADYGVIPIENSTTGSIKDVFDLLNKYNCFIVGETQVRVDHCLMGLEESSIEDITDIYSHEQSLMQCSEFLETFPDWELHSYDNNALAAKFIKEEKNKHFAAIASERAAKIFNLKVLDRHINFLDINTTRFIVIANHLENSDKNNKISISFAVGHEPGALVKVLNIFDRNQLNLCKIESRPNRKRNWEYNFFVDIEGNITDERLQETIQEVILESTNFRFLGNYISNIE